LEFHHEIFNFPSVFFVGQNAKKRQGVVGGANNNGYDENLK
jgi:dual specificity tyrosine-phosphorylation-regulated kinase 2/3/4